MHQDVFDHSIDVQILRLRRKLERDPSAPRVIQTERGVGYVFGVPAAFRRHLAGIRRIPSSAVNSALSTLRIFHDIFVAKGWLALLMLSIC